MSMKQPIRIISILCAAVLFAISAYTAVALFFSVLSVQIISRWWVLGVFLFNAYGISAFILPLILLYSAIILLIPGWTPFAKTLLVASPLFFLTALISEKIIRSFDVISMDYPYNYIVILLMMLSVLCVFAIEVVIVVLISSKLPKAERGLFDVVGTSFSDEVSYTIQVLEDEEAPPSAELSSEKKDSMPEPIETQEKDELPTELFQKEEEPSQNLRQQQDTLDTRSGYVAPRSHQADFDQSEPIELSEDFIPVEPKTLLFPGNRTVLYQDQGTNQGAQNLETTPVEEKPTQESYDDTEQTVVQLSLHNRTVKTTGKALASEEEPIQDQPENNAADEDDGLEIEIADESVSPNRQNLSDADDTFFEKTTEKDSPHSYNEEESENDIDDDEDIQDDIDIAIEEDLADSELLSQEKSEEHQPKDLPHNTETKGLLKKSLTAQNRKSYSIPSTLLKDYPDEGYRTIDTSTRELAVRLQETLREFKIEVEITGIQKGPVVTMFEVLPPPGVKLSKITGLQDNIALRLAASSVRIVAPIPGKQAVGIEIPNKRRSIVSFREMIDTNIPETKGMALPVVLGKDIMGAPRIIDLAQTPHLLIAGATGSGKSVCVNSIILSLLYNRSFNEVRLLLVDPKIVELKLYNDIAHLLTPVITEPKKAFQALQYCLCEMERRYALFDHINVRSIKSYNRRIKDRGLALERLPYIVIIIDEFADLMTTTGKELEAVVSRLCAMSRAVGIHLVLATQRPSTDVITGLIKANIPSRIAFMVASKIDSRIILDEQGAEKLLGRGDMLYLSTNTIAPVRIQGAFVSEEEVETVVEHVKSLAPPQYDDEEMFFEEEEELTTDFNEEESDPLYQQALDIVLREGKASASYIQRKLKIGYNRAARIVEEMEMQGIVGPANGSKPREVLYS